MPSKTPKQAKAMRAACHDAKTRRATGIPKSTACEFAKADRKARRGKGAK